MLDGLDDIDWSRLRHAYGPAEDVPGVLRAIADGDPGASDEFFSTILHQGTVYAATAPTVPFLVELLDVPGTNTLLLLQLLAGIARGNSYKAVHDGGQDGFARLLGLEVKPAPPPTAEDVAALQRELGWVRACREAVAAGAPTYLRWSESADEAVRAQAVHTLGVSVDRDAPAVAATIARLGREDASPIVRATSLLALETLGVPVESVADPDPLPRLVGALIALEIADVDAFLADALVAVESLGRMPDGDAALGVLDRLERRPDLRVELIIRWLDHGGEEPRRLALKDLERVLRGWRPGPARLAPAMGRLLLSEWDGMWFKDEAAARTLSIAGDAAAPHADALWRMVETERRLGRATGIGTSAITDALATLCRLRDRRIVEHIDADLAAEKVDWDRLNPLLDLLGPWAVELHGNLLHHLIAEDPAGDVGELDRGKLVDAILRICDPADPHLAPLVTVLSAHLLEQPDDTDATRALGRIGPAAAVAMPQLRQQLDSEEIDVRLDAARAIFRITGDDGPVQAVLSAAIDDEYSVFEALEALADLGPAGAALTGRLPDLMELASGSVGENGTAAADVERAQVAVLAAMAYWRITGDPDPVVPVLVSHLESGRLGVIAGAPATPPLVIHGWPDEELSVPLEAVRCLGAIGPAASAALPMLRRAVTSELRQVADEIQDDEWVHACTQAIPLIVGCAPGWIG